MSARFAHVRWGTQLHTLMLSAQTPVGRPTGDRLRLRKLSSPKGDRFAVATLGDQTFVTIAITVLYSG